MRKLFAVIVTLCLVYFIGGWIFVILNWLPRDDFFPYASIVGALASVVSLFSLMRPTISRKDLRNLEVESLYSIAEMAEKIQKLEQEKTKAEGEIEDLDIRKGEMEILVRKASFSLFLKEQLSFHERRVLEITKSDSELSRHLEEVQDIRQKLSALNEKIDTDPNVSVLHDIILTISKREPTLDEVVASLPFPGQLVYLFVRSLSRSFVGAHKVRKK